jgi:hypothetical protein
MKYRPIDIDMNDEPHSKSLKKSSRNSSNISSKLNSFKPNYTKKKKRKRWIIYLVE